MRLRLLHPLVAASVLLATAVAISMWALLAPGAWATGGAGVGELGVTTLALLTAGAAAGFANSGST